MTGILFAMSNDFDDIDARVTCAKAWGHLKTITRHKLLVGVLCFRVGLYVQGVTHDFSKYSPTEFAVGARYWSGHRSPNDYERAACGFSPAWLHHKGRNKHHMEYWMDVVGRGDWTIEGKPMPTRYVIEMLCDRIAACKVYQGAAYTPASALEFFLRQQGGYNNLMHPDTNALLEKLLRIIADEGEKDGIARIKREYVVCRASYGDGIAW